MQLGFLLQWATSRHRVVFFSPTHFHFADQLYLKRRYQILGADFTRYEWVTIGKHRKLILHNFGITPFTKEQYRIAVTEGVGFARRLMNPLAVFRSLAD